MADVLTSNFVGKLISIFIFNEVIKYVSEWLDVRHGLYTLSKKGVFYFNTGNKVLEIFFTNI